ncbi:MAG TPA: HNH endonuclease, partial [Arthrobacter sp.]|nr:HNH endonuclease [Arthrobacter sp.]
GLCERCNLAKETPGFRTETIPGPRHTVQLTTPTGHTYQSTAPPPPGTTTEQTKPDSAATDPATPASPQHEKPQRPEPECPD